MSTPHSDAFRRFGPQSRSRRMRRRGRQGQADVARHSSTRSCNHLITSKITLLNYDAASINPAPEEGGSGQQGVQVHAHHPDEHRGVRAGPHGCAAVPERQGREVQVDPMKPKLKPPGTKRLKLKCDILLSTSAFKFDLRSYTKGVDAPIASTLAAVGCAGFYVINTALGRARHIMLATSYHATPCHAMPRDSRCHALRCLALPCASWPCAAWHGSAMP